jgi:Zn-dependent peptidase ImmA (M78 family)
MSQILPNLNKKKITWRNIAKACKAVNAEIYNIPLNFDGYFVPLQNSLSHQNEIYINSNLCESHQIATAVHELKHAVIDTAIGEILFSYRHDWTTADRQQIEQFQHYEFEACAISAIAILPAKDLHHATRDLFEIEDEFADNLWRIRMFTREKYGI